MSKKIKQQYYILRLSKGTYVKYLFIDISCMKPVLGKHIYIFNVFTSINSETVFGFAYLWDIKQQQLLALILSDQDRTSHKQIYFYCEQTQRKNVENLNSKGRKSWVKSKSRWNSYTTYWWDRLRAYPFSFDWISFLKKYLPNLCKSK